VTAIFRTGQRSETIASFPVMAGFFPAIYVVA
jgi:hypothetical protein